MPILAHGADFAGCGELAGHVGLQIARHLGSTQELAELEARFSVGEIDTRGLHSDPVTY